MEVLIFTSFNPFSENRTSWMPTKKSLTKSFPIFFGFIHVTLTYLNNNKPNKYSHERSEPAISDGGLVLCRPTGRCAVLCSGVPAADYSPVHWVL